MTVGEARSGRTVVARLRVHGGGRLDPLVARSRAEAALRAADPRPAGLPPSAILWVRRLREPTPGALGSRGGGPPSPAWRQAVADALGRLARQATRPARDRVPADADAVLFADEAELLACLARDQHDGTLASHWWWQDLFRGQAATGQTGAALVTSAWLAAPRAVPAALGLLATAGLACSFARSLDEGAVGNLTRAVADAFGLDEPALAALDEAAGGGPRGDRIAAPEWDDDIAPGPAEGAANPPWRPWVTEDASAGIGPAGQVLLGIGLLLSRAPQEVRRSAFTARLHDWAQALARPMPSESTAPRTPTVTPALPDECPSPMHPPPSDDQRLENAVVAVERLSALHDPLSVEGDTAVPASVEPADPRSAGEAARTPALPRPDERPDEPPDLDADAEWSPLVEGDGPAAEAIETGYGGAFFLLNLGLFLGLYGDFTAPRTSGIDLPVWDFVALVGERLIGEGLTRDPIWSLLARLAGRAPDDPPGSGFKPPDAWRLDPAWLMPFPEDGPWLWSAGGGRLRVVHPARFPVLDVPLSGADPAAERERLARDVSTARSAPIELRRGRVPRSPPCRSPLNAWLDRLLPYLRARLVRALGVSERRLAGTILKQPARVLVSGDRLDVILSLDRLPIEVRLSGLDRDPGWIPAAGRAVAFHFE